MGDPAGVGPELALRLLAGQYNVGQQGIGDCIPIIFGDAGVIDRLAKQFNIPVTARRMSLDEWKKEFATVDQPALVDLQLIDAAKLVPAQVYRACGEAAFQYIMAAIEAAKANQIAAITTLPINKEALHAAGHKYPGHTEIFAESFDAARSCMMQYSEKITCSFVTVHVGYSEVPKLLTIERIGDVIDMTAAAIKKIRGHDAKLLVCGLNPHAGENGLFGDREEERAIVPAINAARQRGIAITGPVPPDTAFFPNRLKEFDAIVCMYHDQGHIPVKMLAFDSAVNTTLGLSTIRTSVDHGTAFDIAWQGLADAGSFIQAIKLAAKLCKK